MVGQVKIVGILMVVNGFTVVLAGGTLAAFGSWVMFAMPAPPAGAGGPPAELLTAIYIALGGMVIACGLLQVVAGYRVMTFRNRVLGLVALFLNILVFLLCNCALTAIAMMVYGLIVLFNSEVARAFEMVGSGASPDEVVGRFTRVYHDARDDYDEMSSPRSKWEERRRRRMEDEPPDDEER
jgi:hypothetical protein